MIMVVTHNNPLSSFQMQIKWNSGAYIEDSVLHPHSGIHFS